MTPASTESEYKNRVRIRKKIREHSKKSGRKENNRLSG